MLDRVCEFLAAKYGLQVEIGIEPAPATLAVEYANLRDGVIKLSEARTGEQQAFLLAHVFGHLTQAISSEKYRDLIAKVEAAPPILFSESEKDRYREFEMEAYAWGEALLRACSPVSADALDRYRTYAAVDFATYFSYLQTGQQTDSETFQALLLRESDVGFPKLWNTEGLALPDRLVFDDVNISVL